MDWRSLSERDICTKFITPACVGQAGMRCRLDASLTTASVTRRRLLGALLAEAMALSPAGAIEAAE
jgi:hypothetical protein